VVPSWSWASMQRKVITRNEDFHDADLRAHVLDVVLRHKTDDVTGEVLSGHLDLQGELKALLRPRPFEGGWNDARAYGMFHNDSRTKSDSPTDPEPEDIFDESSPESWTKFGHSWERHLFFMVIAERAHLALLLRVVDDEHGIFKRAGVIFFQASAIVLFAGMDDRIKKSFPCLRYGEEKHTIKII
jgi:hypothetical protein